MKEASKLVVSVVTGFSIGVIIAWVYVVYTLAKIGV